MAINSERRNRLIGITCVILFVFIVGALVVSSINKNSKRNLVIEKIKHPSACELAAGLVAYGPDNPLALPPSVKVSVSDDKKNKTDSTCGIVIDDRSDKYYSLITVNYNYSLQKDNSASKAEKNTSETNNNQYYYEVRFSKGFYDGSVLTGPLRDTPKKDFSSTLSTIIAASVYSDLPENPGIKAAE